MHSIRPKGSLHNNATDIEDKLSHDITTLTLDQPKQQIWSVTWDCSVSIASDNSTDRETASHKVFMPCIFLHVIHLMISHADPRQPQIEMLAQRSIRDSYSSVGGLNKQIEEIRDLLEIPLTRPELFRYFGECLLKATRKIILIQSDRA